MFARFFSCALLFQYNAHFEKNVPSARGCGRQGAGGYSTHPRWMSRRSSVSGLSLRIPLSSHARRRSACSGGEVTSTGAYCRGGREGRTVLTTSSSLTSRLGSFGLCLGAVAAARNAASYSSWAFCLRGLPTYATMVFSQFGQLGLVWIYL